MLLRILQYIILFFYIFSIQFIGLPFGIGTRILLAVLGLILLTLPKGQILTFNYSFVKLGFLLFGLTIMSVISTLINITDDYQFVDYSFSIVFIILASYFTFNFFLIRKNVTKINLFKILSEGIVTIVLIQSVLAFTMFFSPPLTDLLNSLQIFSSLDEGKLDELLQIRVIGFGIKFFAFGIVNGFALILITSLLKEQYYNANKRLLLWVSYFVIFVVGMMAARTTIIGFSLSLLIYFNPFNRGVKVGTLNNLKLFTYLILIVLIGYVTYIFSFSNSDKFANLFGFGFELFLNYFATGDAQSESLNQMSEMYFWPEYFKTYIHGDGKFNGNNYEYYYMGTDIGWLRLIYYFGIPGTIIYVLTHYSVLKKNAVKFSNYKYTFWVLFLYFILLNLKGFTDIIYLIVPFLFSLNKHNSKLANDVFSK